MTEAWRPSVGAWPVAEGVTFRVWSPESTQVELVIVGRSEPVTMTKTETGIFEVLLPEATAGTRYSYRLDGNGPFPDPASRFQPDGVHGPSEVIDPSAFAWTDQKWQGPDRDRMVVYELHVGTFTPEGTFAAATEKLPKLVELGVNTIELLPLADFPGQRGWGYDGVCLYAPARCYGRPDDLRRLVDTAHRLGLSVLIDAVYNHLGPDGNYLSTFSKYYFSTTHQTDWGTGPNFDGDQSNFVEDFFVENALHWINEYHFDGLRLDATHAIVDEGERHILELLADRVHQAGQAQSRSVVVIAEDERNLVTLVQPRSQRGFGLDGVWADDLHHQLRRAFAGDQEGYYADYTGTAQDIVTTLTNNWFYTGQPSLRKRIPRGTQTTGVPPQRFVVCIQNHDQIGNRAFGERLNHQIDPSAYRAVSSLLLFVPQTPLLFMGQEWAASTPFLYFTDHNPELGKLVTEGRRREFRHFRAFNDPLIRDHIPDPQAVETFRASQLKWSERNQSPQVEIFRLYQMLLKLRNNEPAFGADATTVAEALAERVLRIRRTSADGKQSLMLIVSFGPGTVVSIPETGWELVFTTEDEPYSNFRRTPTFTSEAEGLVVHFPCSAAVVCRRTESP